MDRTAKSSSNATALRRWWRDPAARGTRWLTLAALISAGISVFAAIELAQAQSSSASLTPISAQVAANFHMEPITQASGAPPLVMLVMSRDEQLYNKAYSDYTDLDGDGSLDTTYNNNFDYIGYFDPALCYDYNGSSDGSNSNSASNYFSVSGNAGGTASGSNTSGHLCTGHWSGNFLNWVAMSRLDLLRYVLYGGYRSTDATDNTILERAYVPDDAHAWAKVYNGSDIANYVPSTYATAPLSFCNASLTTSNSVSDGAPPVIRVARGSYTEWAATESVQCQWRSTYSGGSGGYAKPNVPNDTATGSTAPACPASYTCTSSTQTANSCPSGYSCTTATTGASACPSGYTCSTQTAASCPSGYTCSSASTGAAACPTGYTCGTRVTNLTTCPTGYTCTSSGSGSSKRFQYFPYTQYTYFQFTQNSFTQYAYNQVDKIAELTARVKVCDATASAQEAYCRTYTDTAKAAHLKPAGLLQKFGENGQLRFGLMTGSYAKPRSGGQLRRNIGLLAGNVANSNCGSTSGDEINLTNGVFCTGGSEGIIKTLNLLHQPGWGGGSYNVKYTGVSGNSGGDCPNFDILNRDGISGSNGYLNNPGASGGYNCAGWGNPLAEIYAEALRYIEGNGKAPLSTYVADDTKYISGIPNTLTWTDPYTLNNWCASCSIIVLSTGLDSFDTDELPTDLGFSATTTTDSVGANENINGNSFVIGRTGALSNTTYADLCSAQTIPLLSNATGICPVVSSLEGGFDIAGLAWKAWTTDLRPDLSSSISSNNGSGKPSNYVNKVQTYAISLAENLPSYSVPLSNGAVSLTPLCQSNNNGGSTTNPVRDANGRPTDTFTGGWRSCGFLSLTVGQRTSVKSPFYVFGLPTTYDSTGTLQRAGSFSVVWEDSTWGNDHDLDGNSMVSFCVGTTCTSLASNGAANGICWNVPSSGTSGSATYNPICDGSGNVRTGVVDANTVLVRVEALSVYAGNSLMFGFSTTGAASSTDTTTTAPTMAVPFTVNGAHRLFVRPGCAGDNSLLTNTATVTTASDTSCNWSPPQVVKFTGGAAAAGTLQNPLFYAAKYGGFTGSKTLPSKPSDADHSDWDQINNDTGVAPGDGVPDNFYRVRNPAQLIKQLSKVFQDILRSTGSGTAAAVVSNQREGDGATYQALYEPSRTDNNDRTVTWLGTLQSLFVDSKGYLREDGNGDDTLQESDYATDPVVDVFYDTSDKTTKVRRYSGLPSAVGTTTTIVPLDQLRTIWNARDPLAALTNAQVASNRTYSSSAGTGRYIFTFIDKNLNGVVDSGESVAFDLSSFISGSTNTWGLLNVGDATSAQTLVNYARGQDVSGLRSRTIDYKNDGNLRTYRLGDIVNSTPTVVGTPAEAFDLLYNDQTFATFRQQYQFRRNVIYVGANDGMLHAFNGGFYNAYNKGFQTTPIDGTTATAHPLGSELWAYVPFNLLPHLMWLTSNDYAHVYYFDATPRVFDARIFKPDTDHPGGWGTVLVAGLRFGGGDVDLPASKCANSVAFNGFSLTSSNSKSCTSPTATIPSSDIYTHSAFVVLDVTNPEVAPKLLAELGTDPFSTTSDYGFTTSYPTAATFSARGGSTADTWFLTFGNGPTDLGSASVSASARLYIYRMTAGSSGGTSVISSENTLSLASNAFAGDPVSVDWNLDFNADNLYIGTASGTAVSPGGALMKIDTKSAADTSKWTVSTLTNPAMPVLATPSVAIDGNGQHWVYAGSGRLFVSDDKKKAVTQQSLFGVIDGTSNPAWSGLLDVSSALVKQSDLSISGVTGATTESSLETKVKNAFGWKILLNLPGTNATTSAERVLSSSALIGNTLFATAYTPDTSLCTGAGDSRLFGLNFITGVASPTIPALGTFVGGSGGGPGTAGGSGSNGSANTTYFANTIDLGAGLGAAPSLHADTTTDANGVVTVVTQTSTGAIVTNNATVAPTEKNGEIDWRETLPNSEQ